MTKHILRLTAAAAVAAWMLATFDTSAQTPSSTSSWVPIQSVAPNVSTATPGLPMQPGEPLHISVSLKMRDKAGLDALTAGGSAPPLTHEQFLNRYAPTADQVNTIVAYLKTNGFVNVTIAPNNLLVNADGTAGTVKAAFHVDMRHFKIKGRDAYANINAPVVPLKLSDIVLSVNGLQTVNLSHTLQ